MIEARNLEWTELIFYLLNTLPASNFLYSFWMGEADISTLEVLCVWIEIKVSVMVLSHFIIKHSHKFLNMSIE